MSCRARGNKRASGDFTPSQFAACIESSLNIHALTEKCSISTKETPLAAQAKNSTHTPTHNSTIVPTSNNQDDIHATPMQHDNIKVFHCSKTELTELPRVECTNGAIEALRLCHAAFLSRISSTLVTVDSSSEKKNSLMTSRKRKQTSPSKISSLSAKETSIKLHTERDVEQCLAQMGLTPLFQRANEFMTHQCQDLSCTPDTNTKRDAKDTISTTVDDQKSKISHAMRKKQKKHPFANFMGTQAELIAEQERLLLESAHRMKINQTTKSSHD